MTDATANKQLIQRFYAGLNDGDGDAMAACYGPEIRFSDPVFTDLRGTRAGDMWRMLASAPGEVRVELLEHDATDTTGSAHWKAHYTFSQTGRPVTNDIRATYRFDDGMIVEHRDTFDFYAWARQALGPSGVLLGWTPFVKAAVRRRAATALDKFTRSRPS